MMRCPRRRALHNESKFFVPPSTRIVSDGSDRLLVTFTPRMSKPCSNFNRKDVTPPRPSTRGTTQMRGMRILYLSRFDFDVDEQGISAQRGIKILWLNW